MKTLRAKQRQHVFGSDLLADGCHAHEGAQWSGIGTVSTVGEEAGFAGTGLRLVRWVAGRKQREAGTQTKKAERKMANVRRGHFMIGYLFENLLASRRPIIRCG